jgi:hypothetical protein
MKTTMAKWATKAAGAGAVALLLATPAVAQSRGDWNRNNGDQNRQQQTQRDSGNYRNSQDSRSNDNRSRDNNNYNNNSYRENQRVNLSGKVSSFSHERDGYRIRLEGNEHSFWVPESNFRGRQLRAGISIGFGGVFRGGSIYVDAVSWPGDGYNSGYGYDGGYLRGVVERVDYRDGTLRIRDTRDGRIIVADMAGDRYSRNELRSLRRGDRVALSGQWLRGGVFGVDRIERR